MTRKTVPCIVDLQATHEHFHAHVELQGVDVGPGDSVLVHGLPPRIPFGTTRQYASHAEVAPAGFVKRSWTRLVGRFGFQDLYDVGFEG